MKKFFLFAAAAIAALSMNATVWNVSDWAEGTVSDFDKGGLVLIPGSKTLTVDANEKSWTNPNDPNDSFSFTKRLKTGGAGKATERAIQISVGASEFVEVWAMTSGKDKTGKIYFGSASADITGDALNYFCYQNKGAATDLIIYADQSTNYYAFRTAATGVANVGDEGGEGGEGGESAAGVWDFANWPAADGYTNQVRENLGLYACSPSAETQISNFGQTEASAKKFSDGYQGVNRFKLNGAGFASDPGFTATPTQRFVYFNVTAASTIKIWFRGGGSGDRILYVTDGNEVLGEMKTTNSDPYIMEATSKGAGRIYIFADKAQNLYKIEATNVGTTEEIKDGGQGFDELNAAPKAVKRIINGQVVIVKEDGRMFNLLGAEITL